jgi:predicted  nucleic acid-binding Zn-ribbon protein
LNSDRLSALQTAAAGRNELASLGAAKNQLDQQVQDLQAELQETRGRLLSTQQGPHGATDSTNPASTAALQSQLDEARILLTTSSADVAAANERVTSTTQFQQMRALMHKKNEQIEELRGKLAEYEPEAAAHIAGHK